MSKFKKIQDSNLYFPSFQEVKVNGMRFYRVDGKLFPSVTTVLSVRSNEAISQWRESIGEDVANYEMRRAAFRGKIFHSIIESYLNNESIDSFQGRILPMGLFRLVQGEIDLIDNIRTTESTMCSRNFEIAGRVDLIADFQGITSVIDFKSANRAKNEDQQVTHAIQETAYSLMWEEITGQKINQIVTIVACENGDSQTIIKNPNEHVDDLRQCIIDFKNYQKSRMVMN